METHKIIYLNRNLIKEILNYLNRIEKQRLYIKIQNKKIFTILLDLIEKISYKGDLYNLKEMKTICTNFQKKICLDNLMILFRDTNNTHILGYVTSKSNISLYDLEKEKLKKTISTFINKYEYITCIKHFIQNQEKSDFILASFSSSTIKIFSGKLNFNHLLTIDTFYNSQVNTFIIFKHFNNPLEYIICTAAEKYEPIKLFDLNGKFVRDFCISYEKANFMKIWYNKKQHRYYLINLNEDTISIYDIDTGLLYRYLEQIGKGLFSCFIISNEYQDFLFISNNSFISIWNIEKNNEERRIEVKKGSIKGILKWNEEYFLIGCDKFITICTTSGTILKQIKCHRDQIISMRKFKNNKYGEVIFTCGLDGIIKMLGFY